MLFAQKKLTIGAVFPHYHSINNSISNMDSFKSKPSCQRISEQFLCGIPLNQFDFMDIMVYLSDERHGAKYQAELLELTSLHPLAHEYPLKALYQQLFFKTIVKELEKRNAEISDDLYNHYCTLLGNTGESDGWRFRIYTIQSLDEPYQHIVLRESDSLISNGTTGLCSWQATEDLVNWCSENSHLLTSRCVLELGSGPGLAGLSIVALCQPKTFYFSDGHLHVLELLKNNVLLNAKRWRIEHQEEEKKSTSSFLKARTIASSVVNRTSVSVLDLPWENIKKQNFDSDLPFDVIVASDVVYDTSIFEPLSSALVFLTGGGCHVILACAERNPDTLKEFIALLESLDLVVTPQKLAKKPVLSFTNAPPSKIYLIKK